MAAAKLRVGGEGGEGSARGTSSADALAADLLAAYLRAEFPAQAPTLQALWQRADALPGAELGWALHGLCEQFWASDPARTRQLAELAHTLAQRRPQPELQALAAWTRGVAWLSQGQPQPALDALQAAAAAFDALGQHHAAARTAVGQLTALALLGRYEDAIACGERARPALDAAGDARAAGKLALNLGNLAAHRDHHDAAAAHYSEAASRLAASGDTELELAAVTGLADLAARRHEFERAHSLYEQAWRKAQAGGCALLLASIDGDLGALEMRRGRYAQALSRLERSRRAYEALDVPHLLAVAEQSLADAYLELNLMPEALALYDCALATFVAAGLATDRAWTLAQRGRVLGLLGRTAQAGDALAQAEQAFASEGNPVGSALVQVWQAQQALWSRDWTRAAERARCAMPALEAARHLGWSLHAQILLAQALHGSGDPIGAQITALAASRQADALALPAAQRQAWQLLGLLARGRGDAATARDCFERQVASIESQRGSLPGEEFRSAFLGDKLLPYAELARASLEAGGAQAAAQSLRWVERARARTLAEAMDDPALEDDDAAQDDRRKRLRLQLDDCYRRLGRPDEEEVESLLDQARQIEAALLEQGRRSAIDAAPHGGADATCAGPALSALDLEALHAALGASRALVEYFAIDDALLAFVVAGGRVRALRLPQPLSAVHRRVEQLRFQIDTLRHGTQRLAHRLGELQQRALGHLQQLHAALWAPLAEALGPRHAVVVPHAALHYLPFAALHDGERFEIERREFCRAASAAVLLRCLARRAGRPGQAWVLGHADARLPAVQHEVEAVAAAFTRVRVMQGVQASAAALRQAAGDAAVLHVACHAQFRNDSPRFSALHLADGLFTARDAARLRLAAPLVTLSGCETGVSAIMPGDELIGLTQAFIAAGAARVIASLWTVQDEGACALMGDLYRQLGLGAAPAAALRSAQLAALQRQPHPYFWAAFALHGGW